MAKKEFMLFFVLGLMIGLNLFFYNPFAHAQQISSSTSSLSTSSSTTIPANSSGTNNLSTSSINSIPTPITNSFNYTPLPTNDGGPQNDISESSPLTVNRSTIQVDDWATFSVTVKNVATYNKMIQALCFESTAGNFGCDWGINLAPGQTYTANNVGSWNTTGIENIWVTWTQDGTNWYQPLGANKVSVNVI